MKSILILALFMSGCGSASYLVQKDMCSEIGSKFQQCPESAIHKLK